MALYELKPENGSLEAVPATSFAQQQVKERADLQRALREHIDVLGEDLLLVAEEYGAFQDSRRRIDLLALDRVGRLVVIEIKRTDDGGHMELQALRYAAMVSTMTYDVLVETYAQHHGVEQEAAQAVVAEHVEDAEFDELSSQVRIVLVAADFSTEITATVLWLNEQYGLDVQCWRLAPYAFGGRLLLDLQQIIPLPEAEDYRVHQRRKGVSAEQTRTAVSSRDYGKYMISIDGEEQGPLSKQRAIRTAVVGLVRAGLPAADVRGATSGRRWLAVTPHPGETVGQAFRREHPGRGNGYWFELDISEGEQHWVMPTLGGRRTEQHLDRLKDAATGRFDWRRVDEPELS